MDQQVKKIFEVADDSLQDLLLYFLYVLYATKVADRNGVLSSLPQKQYPHTHIWGRNYDSAVALQAMEVAFEVYHTRTSLISQCSIFERALSDFVDILTTKSFASLPKPKARYWELLDWAIKFLVLPHLILDRC